MLEDVRTEDARRLDLANAFLSHAESDIIPLAGKMELHVRQISASLKRLLEGRRLSKDDRMELQLLQHSLQVGGFALEEELMRVVQPPNEWQKHFAEAARRLGSPLEPPFRSIQKCFEHLGKFLFPDEAFVAFFADEEDGEDSFFSIDGLEALMARLSEMNEDWTSEEQEIALRFGRWEFDDRGLSRRLFSQVPRAADLDAFVQELLDDARSTFEYADQLATELTRLEAGEISVEAFSRLVDPEPDDEFPFTAEELEKELPPELLNAFFDSLENLDAESQSRGAKKRNRKK